MKVGILGGGQLGQMMALAGTPLGIEVSCFDASPDVPAALAGEVVVGQLTETEKLRAWAKSCDVLTYEFENFPTELVADLAEHVPVYPSARALAVAQDRWAEKRLFDELEIAVAPFRTATSIEDVKKAIHDFDYPVVVKTRTGGYDGKGQVRVRSEADLSDVETLLTTNEVIVESFVQFDSEASVIAVRSRGGTIKMYPVAANDHRNGILHTSNVPSLLSSAFIASEETAITKVLKALDYVGVLTLELFVVGETLLANEMAPRVHNSGHWTIEGAETSQFENHLRAVLGLPLGSTDLRSPSAMVNIIGTMPAIEPMLTVPGAALHVYGKSERPGRKLGHVTVTSPHEDETLRRRREVEALLAD